MLIAGNWKMNTDLTDGVALAVSLAEAVEEHQAALRDVQLAVCPPYVSLQAVGSALKGSRVALGAQNVHQESEGAYTGEISAGMLVSAGCTHVTIGHSERRQYMGETDDVVRAKIHQARVHDLTPVLCVGESKSERDAGDAKAVVRTQLNGGLSGIDIETAPDLVVAYEPVWAIGTGDTATPEQANEMHALIREELGGLVGNEVAADVHILYGGSMKPHNAADLLGQSDVDGGLIGGASLDAESFTSIALHGADVG